MKVIQMKKMGYDPIGCSKSIRLEKVRLRKKLDHTNIFQFRRKDRNDIFSEK